MTQISRDVAMDPEANTHTHASCIPAQTARPPGQLPRLVCSSLSAHSPQPSPQPSLNSLPDDLLEVILSKMQSVTDLLAARTVSRRWRNTIDASATIWRTLSFSRIHIVPTRTPELCNAAHLPPASSLSGIRIRRTAAGHAAGLSAAQLHFAIQKSRPFSDAHYNAIAKHRMRKGLLSTRPGSPAPQKRKPPSKVIRSELTNTRSGLPAGGHEHVVRRAAAASNPWAALLEAIVYDRKPVFRALSVQQPLATDLVTVGLQCHWPEALPIDAIQGELRNLIRYGGWVAIHAARNQQDDDSSLPSGAVVGLIGIQPAPGGKLQVRQRIQFRKPIYCADSPGLWVPSLALSETMIRSCHATGCI